MAMAALVRERAPASASALTWEVESAPASALTRQLEPALAPARPQDSGGGGDDGDGDEGVLTLVSLRDRMKNHLMEYNAAVLGGQENFPDHIIDEKCIQKYVTGATRDLQKDIEELKVSFWNKTLALKRIQIVGALRNKVTQDDEESRLILETMKHIVLLSRTIIEYQQQAHQKEQQLIDIKRKRLLQKNDGGQKLQQVQTMMKRQKEKQANANVTETEKLLNKLEEERWMTMIIQNVFQTIIIGSKINWAADPSLKAVVLQLEKNVS